MHARWCLSIAVATVACGKTSGQDTQSKEPARKPRLGEGTPARERLDELSAKKHHDAPLAYKLPPGWHAHDQPGALLLAAKGDDAATLEALVISRLEMPVTFETDARCKEIAQIMAEPMNGTVGEDVRVETRTQDHRGSCTFSIEQGGRTRRTTLIEASDGPPIVIQCEGPSPNANNAGCQAILDSIDLP